MKYEYDAKIINNVGSIEISDNIVNNMSIEEKDNYIKEIIKNKLLENIKFEYEEFVPCVIKFARNTMLDELSVQIQIILSVAMLVKLE